MKKIYNRVNLVAVLLATSISPISSANSQDNLIINWNQVVLEAVRSVNPYPPVTARMLAVIHTCMYDSWAAYDKRAFGTQLGDTLRRPASERTQQNKEEAISYAAYFAAVDLFPDEQERFDTLMQSLGYNPPDGEDLDPTSAAGIAAIACGAVLEYRHSDGSNQLGDLNPGAYSDYTDYEPVNTPDEVIDPNYWQPLRVDDGQGGTRVQEFLVPHWGRVKAFSFRNPQRFKVKRPAGFGSKMYLEQAREIIAYSANLTDIQKMIAQYWAAEGEGFLSPSGHWNQLAQLVSQRDEHCLDEDVKMFFALNNAVMDAGIWAWWAKRKYDYVRPITAIHYLFSGKLIEAWAGPGQGTGLIDGGDWLPYQLETFVTPDFAEYVSGHSTFSAAAAEVLRRFTGSDVFGYSYTFEAGSSMVEPGIVPASPLTLSWATFSAAADESGISRRYGGIHFRDGDLEGRRVGKKIGLKVWKKSIRLFHRKHASDKRRSRYSF